ncbi:hypothetical protein FJ444_20580 [Aestuariibacter sp. GS-14]|nr:hypothetical protein FJ444_20580 [Aestuariibacter sp. GS-14]
MLEATPMVKTLNWRAYLSEPDMRDMLLGSLAGLLVKVLAAISLFAMNVVVTRTIGAAEAGLFFLAFTLITIIATAGRIGLDQAVVRFIASDVASGGSKQTYSVFSKAIQWTLAVTLGLSLVCWLGAEWLNNNVFELPGFEMVFRTMLFSAPFMALYLIHAQALQGLKKVSRAMLVSSVVLPVGILLLILLMPVNNAKALSDYVVFASVLTLATGWYFWMQSAPEAKGQTPFSSALLRATCMPLWTVAIVHQVIQWSSQLLLGVWESAESVAYFATAQRTAMLTSFILFAVNTIAAPKFAAMHSTGNMPGVKRMALISVRIMLAVSVPVTLCILLFPAWLMSVFGEEFRQAAPALVILAIGQFINIATGSVGYLLSMTGNETKVRDNVVISGVVTVVLGIFLIPSFGVIGASIAYACGVASQNLLGVYQVNKHLGFNTLCFWRS